MRVIKDLVPDLSNVYKQLKSIHPWLKADKKLKQIADTMKKNG